jgi:hypothetical protein
MLARRTPARRARHERGDGWRQGAVPGGNGTENSPASWGLRVAGRRSRGKTVGVATVAGGRDSRRSSDVGLDSAGGRGRRLQPEEDAAAVQRKASAGRGGARKGPHRGTTATGSLERPRQWRKAELRTRDDDWRRGSFGGHMTRRRPDGAARHWMAALALGLTSGRSRRHRRSARPVEAVRSFRRRELERSLRQREMGARSS